MFDSASTWRFRTVAAGALLLIVAAAYLSHLWDKDGALDPLYLILLLGVLALFVAPIRDWIASATNIKLPGGIEIEHQIKDAVADASRLPISDEEEEDGDGENELRILSSHWRQDPQAAVVALHERLEEMLRWLKGELRIERGKTNLETIDQLTGDRLIAGFEARIARAVDEISPKAVERALAGKPETRRATVNFMRQADRVVYQLRLIALDSQVRQMFKDSGLRLLDIGGQPRGRWPDFYAYHPNRRDQPLRVAVRMARTPKSTLIDETRGRMRRKWPETPFDEETQRLIVYPETSETKPAADEEIPAIRRDELTDWLVEGLGIGGDGQLPGSNKSNAD